MKLLEGRTAVITGGAQGIGRAIAQTFVEHGAAVVLGDLDGEAAQATATQLAAGGGNLAGVACNVTSEQDVQRLIATAVDTYGRLDIFVNNAGITRDATMRKMTIEQFTQVIDVHLLGTWLGTKHASEAMREHGGSIVNLSSISARIGNFGQTNYSAAKAGVVGLTKAASKEGARYGIRVNAIQPGLIRTAMTEAMPKEAWEAKMADIPLGRAGEPEEVASVALFLASDLSSYVTGTVIEVTGGR